MNTMDGVNNGYIAGLSGKLIKSYLHAVRTAVTLQANAAPSNDCY